MPHSRNIAVYLDSATAGEPPWTAARCNRLLRPVTAQIRVVRELVYPQLHASAASSSAPSSKDEPPSCAKQQDDEETEGAGRRRGVDDPDWIPNAAEKKGSKRIYSNRTSKAEARPALHARKPGEISMPTPLIVRQVSLNGSPRAASPKPASGQSLQTPKKRAFSMLNRSQNGRVNNRLTIQQRRHIDRLLQAFRTLLHATQSQGRSRATRTGTRSLMSTCLRQVPVYIEGRQEWEDEENDHKVDASEEVYEELEQMGTAAGWRPLREVTRAHGVALVTAAVEDELLDINHIKELVSLCRESLAYDEAEGILTAFMSATAPFPPPKTAKDDFIYSDARQFSAIATAYAWAEAVEAWSFFYRLLRSMLTSNLLSVEWTATMQFKAVWSRIIQHISNARDPAHAEACRLANAFLPIACGKALVRINEESPGSEANCAQPTGVSSAVKNALNTTVASLSAIFAAICLLPDREASFGRRGKDAIQHTLEMTATDITTDVLEGHFDDAISGSSSIIERLSNVLTCAIIVGVCTFDRDPNMAAAPVPLYIRALARLEGITQEQLLNLPGIVCSVAETCGKAYYPKTTQNVFLVLRSTVEALKSYRLSSFDDGKFTGPTASSRWGIDWASSWILKRLALDSAHEFANRSRGPDFSDGGEYLRYTLEIEKEMENIQMPQHNITFFHKDADYHAGYRWDSGISEWVEATPLVRKSLTQPAAEAEASPPEPPSTSTPAKSSKVVSTPARPTLSQLLMAQSPDVLGIKTPAAAFSQRIAAAASAPPSTPVMTSTPAALKVLRNDDDDDETASEGTPSVDSSGGYETDELALTSPVRQASPDRLPASKRASESGGGAAAMARSRSTTVATLSAALGLDGADDSEDELSFL
ncbi:uncharacterized protein BKCO1_4100092 [Diplodia corticola]|uniref:Uncharacterized protein n=1 Tax=Diplodia corticola TaxID=236234 RepID=A0A1J9RW83_9PEZI|nr:uncharacterized protein BKCO1_4100092 [Diplodia corticola]OJD32100.1 hypothetical protein BKCO1_4100092 [Diplodia corticola]